MFSYDPSDDMVIVSGIFDDLYTLKTYIPQPINFLSSQNGKIKSYYTPLSKHMLQRLVVNPLYHTLST